jgi:hypothetical protein
VFLFSTSLAPQLTQNAGLPVNSLPQREQNTLPPSG